MGRIKTAIDLFLHNKGEFIASILLQVGAFLPDKLYLRLLFRFKMGKRLILNKPVSFNEKLQWLKLYDRKPEYTALVDKLSVKSIVAKIIGNEYVIPTLGVWDSPEQIDWNGLPNEFVLKTTHGGGSCGVVICKDKLTFNKQEAISTLKQSLKQNIYKDYREWPYKDVPRKIIAEPLLVDDLMPDEGLKDYKFFCFNGRVKLFKIDFDRFVEHHANYYSNDGVLLPFGEAAIPPVPSKRIKMPSHLSEMIKIAEQISVGHPFLRVDLYECNNMVYFGEITFFPAGGFGRLNSDDWDVRLGEMIKLPNKK